MEGFRTFTCAMDRASDVCSKWTCADDGVDYSYAELMLVAAHLDSEGPLDDRQWYIVFPDGEICMAHEDFEEIMPLWKPVKSKPIKNKLTGDEFYPEENKDYKFCTHCGQKLPLEAEYCSKCGRKVN